ncbi:hypothetical protein [uncultured Winogradskyella sp.]|uniref:hypothetical protein n=1 Tax=uncultured Winogradskyella sp. TaxID=395353 RepID=UPI00262D5F5D|nr:hypothetical protein [uncultured Winogradskyella sp.]
MNTINSITLFVALNLLIVGLSHVLQPRMWLCFFQLLTKKGIAGNAINALLHFGFGSLIVSFHFLWSWPRVLITFYGALVALKGIIYLFFSSIGVKSVSSLNENNINKFKWAGLVMAVLSIPLFYNLSNIWI